MQLPPLDSIRFFEVAGRRLSVRLAADELHVTPGAVSQQVRKLERYLDRSLFDRLPRGLALTAAGVEYHAACQEALSMIGRVTTRLKGNRRRSILISCTAYAKASSRHAPLKATRYAACSESSASSSRKESSTLPSACWS